MPIFPSQEWCVAFMDLVQADSESARIGVGWKGDVAAVCKAQPPDLGKPFAIYFRPVGGRVTEFRVLEDLDEVEEIEPSYVAMADFSVWKNLIRGELDPFEALIKRRIELRGNLQQIIERAAFRGVLQRALAAIKTEFPMERR